MQWRNDQHDSRVVAAPAASKITHSRYYSSDHEPNTYDDRLVHPSAPFPRRILTRMIEASLEYGIQVLGISLNSNICLLQDEIDSAIICSEKNRLRGETDTFQKESATGNGE